MEFSMPEYWSGLPSPSLGDLPNPGTEPRSPALQVDSLPSEPQGKPIYLENSGENRLCFNLKLQMKLQILALLNMQWTLALYL